VLRAMWQPMSMIRERDSHRRPYGNRSMHVGCRILPIPFPFLRVFFDVGASVGKLHSRPQNGLEIITLPNFSVELQLGMRDARYRGLNRSHNRTQRSWRDAHPWFFST